MMRKGDMARRKVSWVLWLPLCFLVVAALLGGSALGQGGKEHSGAFTALQALQKATETYERLVEKGELDATWETGLMRVVIRQRIREDRTEYVVPSTARREIHPRYTSFLLITDNMWGPIS